MSTLVVRIGATLFVLGFACTIGAMTFGVAKGSHRVVWRRGSFQRRSDYTKPGWRLYWLGTSLGVTGALAFASGQLLK